MICGSGGSKSRLAKAAGAEPAGQMSDEKLHAVVARSTFRIQNVQNTSRSEVAMSKKCTPLWRKAHYFPSENVQNTPRFGPLLAVAMSKKCTPFWREAHFEVKMYKTLGVRTTFGDSDVEKVHAVLARSTFRSQNVQNTRGSDHFWRFRCRKKCTPFWREAHFEAKMLKTPGVRTTFGGSDVASLHYTTLHYTTLHYITLHYTTFHYTPLHYITLHYITLNDTAPQIDG